MVLEKRKVTAIVCVFLPKAPTKNCNESCLKHEKSGVDRLVGERGASCEVHQGLYEAVCAPGLEVVEERDVEHVCVVAVVGARLANGVHVADVHFGIKEGVDLESVVGSSGDKVVSPLGHYVEQFLVGNSVVRYLKAFILLLCFKH